MFYVCGQPGLHDKYQDSLGFMMYTFQKPNEQFQQANKSNNKTKNNHSMNFNTG